MILAYALTGKSKDYGPTKADELRRAPDGFDSVCGTEMNQKVFPVQKKAALKEKLASALLDFGDRYGRQFAVFRSDNLYPAYVVRYQMNPDEARMHRAEVVSTGKSVKFIVKGEVIWQEEVSGIALVVLDSTSLEMKRKLKCDPWIRERKLKCDPWIREGGYLAAARLCDYIAEKVDAEDIVLMAITRFVSRDR